MKRKNEIKPSVFEVILGKEKSDRRKVLVTLALYGEYRMKRKATKDEINEIMDYHNQIMPIVLDKYKGMSIVNGEVCCISENLPPIPMHKWTNYLEHIEWIQKEYEIEESRIINY